MAINFYRLPVYTKTAAQILNALQIFKHKQNDKSNWFKYCNVFAVRPDIDPSGCIILSGVEARMKEDHAVKSIANILYDFIQFTKFLDKSPSHFSIETKDEISLGLNRQDQYCQNTFYCYTTLNLTFPWIFGLNAMHSPSHGYVEIRLSDVWLLQRYLSGENANDLLTTYGEEAFDRVIGHPWNPMKSERAKLILDMKEEENAKFLNDIKNLEAWHLQVQKKLEEKFNAKQTNLQKNFNNKLSSFLEDFEKLANE